MIHKCSLSVSTTSDYYYIIMVTKVLPEMIYERRAYQKFNLKGITMFRENNCTYCGEPSDTKDHVTPVSEYQISRKNVSYSRDKVIPCCKECNNVLGNINVFRISERANYLYHRYRDKYKRHINLPRWSKDEILSQSKNVQQSIYDAQQLKLIIFDRLEFLTLVERLDPSIRDVWDEIDNSKASRKTRKSSLRQQYEMYDAIEAEDMTILKHIETGEELLLTSNNRSEISKILEVTPPILSMVLKGRMSKIKEWKVLPSLPDWMID